MTLSPGRDSRASDGIVATGDKPQGTGCRQIQHRLVNRGQQIEDLVVLTVTQHTVETVTGLPRPAARKVSPRSRELIGHAAMLPAAIRPLNGILAMKSYPRRVMDVNGWEAVLLTVWAFGVLAALLAGNRGGFTGRARAAVVVAIFLPVVGSLIAVAYLWLTHARSTRRDTVNTTA